MRSQPSVTSAAKRFSRHPEIVAELVAIFRAARGDRSGGCLCNAVSSLGGFPTPAASAPGNTQSWPASENLHRRRHR